MIALIFYCLIIYGFVVAIQPLIIMILTFIRDTWDKYQEWDKKRIKKTEKSVCFATEVV